MKYKVKAKIYKDQGDVEYEDTVEGAENAAAAMKKVREDILSIHTDVEDDDVVIVHCHPVFD